MLFSELRNTTAVSLIANFIQDSIGSPGQSNQAREKIKSFKLKKKNEVDNMQILHKKHYFRKVLELIKQLSKVVGDKNKYTKLGAFLQSNNKLSEKLKKQSQECSTSTSGNAGIFSNDDAGDSSANPSGGSGGGMRQRKVVQTPMVPTETSLWALTLKWCC